MNKIITIIIGILLVFSPALIAQNETRSTSSYGNTFNVGLGIGSESVCYDRNGCIIWKN
jgi:hypothetical protein